MKRYLYLPDYYDLVVGDTFELFYRGLVNAATIDAYDFEPFFPDGKNRGQSFARKYSFTPTEADIGDHVMHIRLWSNDGEVLEEGQVTLRVLPPPRSPREERVVLLVGASDAGPGIWPAEVGRRLVGVGGAPVGLGLTNVTFLGSRERDGVRYEGYGGWCFPSYLTANHRNDFMILSGDFRDKHKDHDQHSFYRDEQGGVWKLETIAESRMKVICTSALGALPSVKGGRLTHASGGVNHGDIVYTSATRADANPFWSERKGKNDFRAYAARFGKEKIDEVVVTLGWNSYMKSKEVYKDYARQFAASVHADFPNCHITYVGMILPTRDGNGANYGVSWGWFPRLRTMREFDDARLELVREDSRLSFVHLAPLYDSEYNSIRKPIPVNVRSGETVVLSANSLHAAEGGSLEIADAIYRHLCYRLQEE